MLVGFVTNDMSERAALGSSYVLLEELIRITKYPAPKITQKQVCLE